MIFHEHKTIYLHIGKTAGVAIERLLWPTKRDAKKADFNSLFGYDKSQGVYLQHATARLTQELVGQATFNNYYTFTIVRNPFARLVSAYYYLVDQHDKQYGSFENFVLSLPELVSKDHQKKGSHYISQLYYTHINGEPACDYIGYFEHLPTSLDPIRNLLGIKAQLEQHNVINNKNRQAKSTADFYSDEMIDVVRQVYKDDFDILGYAIHPNNTQPLPKRVSLSAMRKTGSEKRETISKAGVIPKKIHQIWIGPNPVPPACEKWMQQWKEMHPDWEYYLWTDANLPEMSASSKHVYEQTKDYAGKADVLRYEVIKQFGGLYVDADFECYKPIDPKIKNINFFGVCPVEGRICNGIFAAVANHPILINAIEHIVPRPPPANGPIWLDKWLREYLPESGSSEKVYIEKNLTVFFPDYAVPWPKNSFGKRISRVSSKKHPFAKHHALKSWMKDEQRKNKDFFYASETENDELTSTTELIRLCCLPTGIPGLEAKIAAQAEAIDEWGKVLSYCKYHDLTLMLVDHIESSNAPFPADVKKTLLAHKAQSRIYFSLRDSLLAELTDLLAGENIQFWALKNLAFDPSIHSNSAFRVPDNIDLLIPKSQLSQAIEVLATNRFTVFSESDTRGRFIDGASIAVKTINKIDFTVELHPHDIYTKQRNSPYRSLQELTDNEQHIALANKDVPALGNEKLLWHMYVTSAGKHSILKTPLLIDLADLVAMIENSAGDTDWQTWLSRNTQLANAMASLQPIFPESQALQQLFLNTDRASSDDQFLIKNLLSEIPPVPSMHTVGRKKWIKKYLENVWRPSPWWLCFYMGVDLNKARSPLLKAHYAAKRLFLLYEYLAKTVYRLLVKRGN